LKTVNSLVGWYKDSIETTFIGVLKFKK